ncbi:ABC transporter permease [Alicyclobacillus cellulosilyticus]|nr:ABC transporter permease [Alicyclobacillus cellulosilyticus]
MGFVICWQLASLLFRIPRYVVPSPWDIVTSAVSNGHDILQAAWFTFLEFFSGYILSIIIGISVAMVMAQSRLIEAILYPYAVFIQTVPIVCIAPMIIVWFGTGEVSIAVISFICSVFPVIANSTTGLVSTDPNLLDLMRLYGVSRWTSLVKLKLPYAFPYIATGAKIASGAAVIGTIIGQYQAGVAGGEGGLGYLIATAASQLQMDYLFVAAVVSCLMGLFIFYGVTGLTNVLLRDWHAVTHVDT